MQKLSLLHFAMFKFFLLPLQLANAYRTAEAKNACLLISVNVGTRSCVFVYPQWETNNQRGSFPGAGKSEQEVMEKE